MEKPLDKDKIKKAIEKSGYLEEQKVINKFEEVGFFSGANFAFEDQDEHKSREVDFIATKFTDFSPGKTGFYFFVYGEVKKKSDPIVFFERKPQQQEPLELYIPVVATQQDFTNIDKPTGIRKILNLKKNHHQLQHGLISTQFCVVDYKKGKAGHKDLYESLFVPLLKCIDSEMQNMSKYVKPFDLQNPTYLLSIFQPLLVISGPLFSYDVYNDEINEKDYIVYRRHYSSNSVKRTLLIDVVSMKYLQQYLSDKLTKTYQELEDATKENIDLLLNYCSKDKEAWNLKVNRALTKQNAKT
jgi:hypothetical protein